MPLVGLALVVVVARWVGRPWRGRAAAAGVARRAADVAVVVMLVLLPAVQALGTGNALAYLAVNQFACWTALMVAACTMPGRQPVARALAVSATACAVVVAATTGADGLLRHPYRTAAWSEATTAVGGTGPLAPMRVDAATAARLREVRAAAGERQPGRPGDGLRRDGGDGPAAGRSLGRGGVVLAHRPGPQRRRNPQRLHAAAAVGRRAPGRHLRPRAPGRVDQDALRGCGLSLSGDYRLVPVDEGAARHLRVYVPIGAEERTRP